MINFKNKYELTIITNISICIIVFLGLLIVSFNYEINNPTKDYINLYIKESNAKTIWTFSVGFFISLSIIFASIYLLIKNQTIILWYMATTLLITLAYSAALLPYYTKGSATNYVFHSINNGGVLGVIICGVRIIQDLTQLHDFVKLQKFLFISTIGFISCCLGHFIENQALYLSIYSVFLFSCARLLFDCFLMIRKATKQNIIGKHFTYIIIFFCILCFQQTFPVTFANFELLNKIRLINSTITPFPFAVFFGAVLSMNIRKFQHTKNEIEILTQEKQAILEAQNETLASQVAEQTSELKALNDTKDRLFSIIGHDLRSPIASLKGVLSLLNNQQLSREEFNELLHYLQKNVDNVYTTLENLLQWSLSQMKEIKPNLKSFEINDVIEPTIELFRDIAQQKKINIQTNISENLRVFADENHIRAIIRNLINNALKFTPNNGQVSITSKSQNNYTILEITDTGVGIATDELELIFTNPTLKQGTSGEKGTGLGLILCKDLIKQNAGKITVQSELQQGTTFEILIPQKAEH